MDDLLQEFIAETRETLEALSGEIVGWEADPNDRGRLDSIFRFVHTIKGSCGFLDLPRLAQLSHAAEDALAAVRSGERAPDAALVTAILAIIDRIGEMVEVLDGGETIDHGGEALLIAALDAPSGPVVPVVPVASVAAAEPGAVTAVPGRGAAKRSVRLSVDLLDRMMSGVSDMVLARNQLARQLRSIDDPRLEAMLERLSLSVDELRDTVTRTRMQRVEALFSALPRLARDAAGSLGKSVALTIEGGDVELDREMIELLRDPLVHLVRNSVDHGIEDRADRIFAGKPATGTLRIVARQAGNLIIIEIADDGRGIDSDRLVAKILREQPSRASELAMLDEEARLRLIFEPGLSSRDEVTAMSGRGVGMDVVKANVEQAGGRISLLNRPGQGLVVSLEVPLTLAILNAVLVDAADTRFAIPRQSVDEIVAVDGSAVRVDRVAGGAVVVLRGQRLPMVSLPVLLGQAQDNVAPRFVAIVSLREGRFALAVDGVRDTQELVVKPAAPAVMRAGIYAGQMLPDDGAPILLLDCSGIAARAALTFEPARADVAEAVVTEPIRGLLFEDVDGVRRMMVSDAVDRIETVAAGAVRALAGGLWLTIDGRSIPVWAGHGAVDHQVSTVLRLQMDGRELAYPVREAIEIVPLPDEIAPAAGDRGVIAGLAVIDGEPIELVDPLALFGADADVAERPLCLLHGAESGWMEAFLRPTIEQAGYRVVRAMPPGAVATVALAIEDDAESAPVPALRLSRTRGQPLYRYDRPALIAALKERRA